MEWFVQTLDDSLFESILTPLTRQILEKFFFAEGPSGQPLPGFLSGFFVFHRELGLVLQNAESRRILPKALLALPFDGAKATMERFVVPGERPRFQEVMQGEKFSAMEIFTLLPDRVEEADTLFCWTGSWNWGRVVFLCAGRGREEGEGLLDRFRKKADTLDPVLEPLLDRWMLDSTLEVFWSRIIQNTPPEYQPIPGGLSPEWFRSVSASIPGLSGKEEVFLCGFYRHEPREGWRRYVERLENGKRKSPPPSERNSGSKVRIILDKTGGSLDIPIDLWGIFDLGTVRLSSALIKKVGFSAFFNRLRRSKVVAMRSLYKHLLYAGKLELLQYWLPDAECFELKMLEKAPQWLGDDILNDPLLAITLESVGTKRWIEDRLRPFDLVLADGRRLDRIYLLLRHCPRTIVESSIIPRLLKIEGMNERQFAGTLTLQEYLSTGKP